MIAAFTFVSIAVGIAQCSALRSTDDSVRAQAEIMKGQLIAAQRPWVSVKIDLGPRGLFFDENGANLDLIITLKNSGPTPAVTARIVGGPRIDVNINDRISEIEKICDGAKSDKSSPKMFGSTVFPGDPFPLHVVFSFSSKADTEKIATKYGGFIHPSIIGCVDYLSTLGDSVHHSSRFIYDVYPTARRAIRPDEGDIPATDLRLDPWIEAGSFQAD